MKKLLLSTVMMTFTMIPAAVSAQQDRVAVSVEVLTEYEITDTTGHIVLERKPLEVATADEKIIYKISIKNTEADVVSNVVLNIPISDSLRIYPQSFTADIPIIVTFASGNDEFFTYEELMEDQYQESQGDNEINITDVRINIPKIPRNETLFIEYDAMVR